ncbi:hypothetical protein YERSI8AC_190040 [Enterobacterales bacterium 8AC]|nr:hypothetical protein YERSI8AC_190040 [Enterobacterales bacterium 8AC]
MIFCSLRVQIKQICAESYIPFHLDISELSRKLLRYLHRYTSMCSTLRL